LESNRLSLGERRVADIGKGRAPPEAQRLPEQGGGRLRVSTSVGRSTFNGEPLESGGVKLVRIDRQDVARSPALQVVAIRAQSLAETRDVDVEGMAGGLGLVTRPEILNEAVGGDQPARAHQQAGQEHAQARCTKVDRATSLEDLHWSEDPIVRAHKPY
jgi:hypothetical protein